MEIVDCYFNRLHVRITIFMKYVMVNRLYMSSVLKTASWCFPDTYHMQPTNVNLHRMHTNITPSLQMLMKTFFYPEVNHELTFTIYTLVLFSDFHRKKFFFLTS